MLIKTLAGVAVFALIGAAVGYSKILCFNGECAMTGTPYGGGLLGGMLGMAVMSGLSSRNLPKPTDPQDDESDKTI